MATVSKDFRVKNGLVVSEKATTAASTTTRAGLSVPHGTAPSAPVDGDIWTTSAGLYARINGVTVGPYGAGGGITVSDAAPGSPTVGQLWYESDTGITYIYYDSFWVQVAPGGGGGGSFTLGSTTINSGDTVTTLSGLTSVSATTFSGSGASLTSIPQSAVTSLTSDLALKAPLASPTFTGTVTAATLDLTTAATASAATAYWVETGSDGVVRPKSLANVKAEILGTPTLTGTITTSLTTAGYVTTTAGGVLGSVATIPNAGLTNSTVTVGTTAIALGASSTTLAGLTSVNVGGTVTATTFSGSGASLTNIPNGALTNSSVTIGSTAVSLGSTVTTFAGLTSVTSTTFVGALTGNASSATNATNVAVTDDTATATTVYPSWVSANTGNLPTRTTSTRLSFVPSTGVLTATQFSGSGAGLTSIPNGALTNSSLTVNGTAISLGGSGTVTAAAGTLTGTVLNATVVTSSLTAVGTITTGVWNAGAITSSGAGAFTSTISASGLAGSLLSSANPIVNGTAAPGTSAIPSRQDHVHPTDTTRAQDSLVVHLAGTESITGAKTFSTTAIFATPTTSIASIRLPHGTAPSAPTNGDMWTTTLGLYARINGTTVGPFGAGGGGASVTVSDTAPVGPTAGNLWFDSTTTKTYIYYDSSWVQVGGGAIIATNLIGGNGTTLLGSVPYQSGTDTTTLLAPNTSTTRAFLGMTGTGTNGAAPSWTSSTGTGNVVLATSPTLTTPNIGVATGTSFNSITGLSSTTPVIAGTAAVGTGTTAARGDHVHPTEIPSQTGNSGRFLTTNGTTTSWGTVIGSVWQATAPTATTGSIWTDSDIGVLYQYNGTAWISPMNLEVFTPTFATNNYTVILADQSRLLLCSNGATAGTVTISSATAFLVGTQIQVVQTGTGQLTLTGSGVTINGTPGLKLRTQYSSATLVKTAATTWLAIGDLAA